MRAALAEIAAALNPGAGMPKVLTGFLEGARYPDGTPVPYVAAIQEFGARIEVEPGQRTIYRRVNAKGTGFMRKGRFVKPSQSNFASDHYVGAHVITIPPRPYFRTMIKKRSPGWGKTMAAILKGQRYDVAKTLALMGIVIKEQLQESILELTSPPLAASTIRKKSRGGVTKHAGVLGPAKPLIDTSDMLKSVDYEVQS